MCRLLTIVAFAGLCVLSAGCGTFTNFLASSGSVPPAPFGGVRNDCDAVSSGNLLACADIPFSLIGDLVTLPDVIAVNSRVRRRQSKGVSIAEAEEHVTTANIDDGGVFRFGMTLAEVCTALDFDLNSKCPWAGPFELECESRRFPAKTVVLAFDDDNVNKKPLDRHYEPSFRLRRWELRERNDTPVELESPGQ